MTHSQPRGLGGTDSHPNRFTFGSKPPPPRAAEGHALKETIEPLHLLKDVPKPDTDLPQLALEILSMKTTISIGDKGKP